MSPFPTARLLTMAIDGCRQAMLFYTLRTLNFELNGLPRKGERQLVIANLSEIKPFLPKPGQV